MHNYSRDDFLSYYGLSFLLHPHTNEVVKVVGGSPDNETNVILSDGSNVHLRELDWKHVKPPRLGYRTVENGRLLYYISRRALRQREKGVTPSAIVIEIPGVMTTIAQMLNYSADTTRLAVLNEKLAKTLYKPEFFRMEEAVKLLDEKAHAVAFALSPDWAVSIGLHKEKPYLLHYKNNRVGWSRNGADWKFNDSDARYIFDRSDLV